MEKEFVSYDIALALKELGFSSEPIGSTDHVFYYENGKLYYDYRPMYSSSAHKGQLIAPLYQQAFRWFREKYQLYGSITNHHSYKNEFKGNFFYIIDFELLDSLDRELKPKELFDTYEEAELACLKKLIEIYRNK